MGSDLSSEPGSEPDPDRSGEPDDLPEAPGPEPSEPVAERPRDASDRSGHHLAVELADYAELEVRELANLAETGDEPPPKPKRWWVLPLRIIVSLALLAVLFWRIPHFSWDELVPTWQAGTGAWLGAAVALTLAAVALSALRWREVLRAMEVRPPFRTLVSHYFAGQFVSNVLPTTIGGDVLRISRLSRDTGDSAATFASVVLERLTGWLVLPVLTLCGLALNPGLRDLGRATNLALTIALGTLGGLAVILVAAYHPRVGGRLGAKEGWRRFIAAVHVGIGRLRRRPATAAGVVGAGVLYQVTLVLAAWAASEALGLDIGVTVLLAFYPAVLIAQVLPIGISGLGVRESAFVIFLTPLGVQPEQAVALGLLLYLLNFGASIAGAPAFAVGGRRRTPAEVTA